MATLAGVNKGTEAMKKTTLLAGLLALANVGALGCKTTPKTAWWKSSKSAESTAVAHSAPTPPSQLATQGAGSQSALAQAGGDAAPFVPGGAATTSTASAATPASYPSTDAPPFTQQVAQQIASTSTTTGGAAATAPTNSANLGSIAALPYNPATPPKPTTTSVAGTPELPASRYTVPGSTTAPAFAGGAAAGAIAAATTPVGSTLTGGSATPGTAAGMAGTSVADLAGAAPRYGAGTAADLINSSPVIGATEAVGRYGNQIELATGTAAAGATTAVGAVAGAATGAGEAVQAAATVATTGQPYRPGGTSSYPTTTLTGDAPQYDIASRPQDPTGTSGMSTTVPSVARPGDTSPSATTPGTQNSPRYW